MSKEITQRQYHFRNWIKSILLRQPYWKQSYRIGYRDGWHDCCRSVFIKRLKEVSDEDTNSNNR